MIKLRLTQKNGQALESDTDIAPGDMGLVEYVQLKGHGVDIKNAGIGSTAPNRCMIDLGISPKNNLPRYRNVVLPDGYPMDHVSKVEIYDSKGQEPLLNFKVDDQNGFKFNALQGDRKQEATKGVDRVGNIIMAFKKQFEFVGDVGVNDLGRKAIITLEVQDPLDEKQADKVLNFADDLSKKFDTYFEVEVKVLQAHTTLQRGYLQGHLGDRPTPELALAGRQPTALTGVSSGTNSADLNQIDPLSDETKREREGGSSLGHNSQGYGSAGPSDG